MIIEVCSEWEICDYGDSCEFSDGGSCRVRRVRNRSMSICPSFKNEVEITTYEYEEDVSYE